MRGAYFDPELDDGTGGAQAPPEPDVEWVSEQEWMVRYGYFMLMPGEPDVPRYRHDLAVGVDLSLVGRIPKRAETRTGQRRR